MRKNTLPIKWIILVLFLGSVIFWINGPSKNMMSSMWSNYFSHSSQNFLVQFLSSIGFQNLFGTSSQKSQNNNIFNQNMPASQQSNDLIGTNQQNLNSLTGTNTLAHQGSNAAQKEYNGQNQSRTSLGNNAEDNLEKNAENNSEINSEYNAENNAENNSGVKSETNADQETGNISAINAENNPGENSESNAENNSEDNSGGNAENNSGDNSGSNAENNSGDNSGSNAENNSGDNSAFNAENGSGNASGGSSGGGSGDGSGCYHGCDSGSNPECAPGCASGSTVQPNLTVLNPIPTDAQIAQNITQQNYQTETLTTLLQSRQQLVLPVQQQAQESKYQTISYKNIPVPSTDPTPSDIKGKVQSKQYSFH